MTPEGVLHSVMWMFLWCCGVIMLTGRFSFCCSAAFFFQSRSRSSMIRLSIAATSRLRLFRPSLCCCNLEFWSWLSLFLSWTPGQRQDRVQCLCSLETKTIFGAQFCFGVELNRVYTASAHLEFLVETVQFSRRALIFMEVFHFAIFEQLQL